MGHQQAVAGSANLFSQTYSYLSSKESSTSKSKRVGLSMNEPQVKLPILKRLAADPELIFTKSLRISCHGINHLSALKAKDPLKNYIIEQSLGRGAYGQVARYRHVKDGKIYAIKTSSFAESKSLSPRALILPVKRKIMAIANEVTVSVALSGRTSAVGLKKILTDPHGEKVHIISELLQKHPRPQDFYHQPQKGLGDYHDLGIKLYDRSPDNQMIRRSAQGKEDLVQIDYGMASVDEDVLFEALEKEAVAAKDP